MATQPAKVNRALAKAGLKVEIVRGNGYYYFTGAALVGDEVRSLYQCSLHQSAADIVQHVRNELARLGPDWHPSGTWNVRGSKNSV